MKISTKGIAVPALLAMLLGVAACDGGKEKALWEQIKTRPSATAIFQYVREYPKGEFIDSVNKHYLPLVTTIDSLHHVTDPAVIAAFCDSTDVAPLKEWGNGLLDSILRLDIKHNPNYQNLGMFLERFPNADSAAVYREQYDKYAAEREKVQGEITRLIAKLTRTVSIDLQELDEVRGGTIFSEYFVVSNGEIMRIVASLEPYKSAMTPEQKAQVKAQVARWNTKSKR